MRLLDSPKVYLVAEPTINTASMLEYLRQVGGEAWYRRMYGERDGVRYHAPDAELLVEFMGRLCYKSWEPGLNKNVVKIREDRGEYLLNVLKSAHGSILEHAMFSFAIRGGSRVFTAEMNRHRAGVAISEQSLRYVRLDDIEFWVPPGLSTETRSDMIAAVQYIEDMISRIYAREFTDDMDFAAKKTLTSKIRRIAPLGLATEEGWSGNIRTIRHVIEMRTAAGAEEEIRIIADQIGVIMLRHCPLLFGDYELDSVEGSDIPAWTTSERKV